jgi:tRNA synthetases class II core domain (F)
MRVFFNKMGIENLRFKPAYNPYTEVSFQSRSPRVCGLLIPPILSMNLFVCL